MEVLEQQEQNTEIVDGYIVDTDTGEILGLAQDPKEFTVHDEDTANWVLGKMLDAEAKLAAIETSEEVVRARAVLVNADAMAKEQRKKIDWLHRRFDNELGEYARQRLAGAKTKTLKTLLGSISLRVKKGGLRVLDPAKALLMAKMDYPHAVKTTESFLISALTDEEKDYLVQGLTGDVWTDNDTARKAFAVEPDSETVTVKTGV